MRYLSLVEVLELHRLVVERTGGLPGVRDLGFSLINNHPFNDGNKRIGHAALETFLVLNGYEVRAPVDEQEQLILRVAAGELGREGFKVWLGAHVVTRPSPL
jgi:death-on-curing protein